MAFRGVGGGMGWGLGVFPCLKLDLSLRICHTVSNASDGLRQTRKGYMFTALRRWLRTHGVYTTLVQLSDTCTEHKSWTKSQALTWMYLHSRKDKVARQQFGKVTNLFGQRIAVRYYR